MRLEYCLRVKSPIWGVFVRPIGLSFLLKVPGSNLVCFFCFFFFFFFHIFYLLDFKVYIFEQGNHFYRGNVV